MKKLFIIFSILLSLNSFAQPGTYSGNFILDLSLYSSTVSNIDFVRGTQVSPMTSLGNNQYSYNFSSFLMSPTIYYNFRVNGVDESFSVLNNCLFINPTTNDTTRLINLNTTTPSVVCWESCSPCVAAIPGCTDPTANNYNPIANLDNDSCLYNVTFFVDMSESNHIFDTLEVNGTFNTWCGDCSQMEDANNDDIWEVTISLTSGSYEYKFSADDWNIQEDLYESDDCVVGNPPYINRDLIVTGHQVLDTVCWNRCYSCDTERNFYNVAFKIDMSNVTSSYTTPEVNGTFNNWCGNCWSLDYQGNNIYSKSFNIDTSLHTFKFSADNWLIQEDLDSNLSCVLINYDTASSNGWGNVNREIKLISDTIIDVCWESCSVCPVAGCTDPLACNYDILATLDDGSCLANFGCVDVSACNYDSLATCDDGSCLTLYGCTDILACNYDSLSTCDDGSCLTIYGCMNSSAINYNSLANCPDICTFPQVTYGCTDSSAINYNPTATIDDTSCIYCYYGCTDSIACNYNLLASCDDGSCLTVYGCTDSIACNYNVLASCDDGSCLTMYGCTDSIACNYNVLAICDDGSCVMPDGCTDLLAYNFDSLAVCNDGSCIYEYNVTFQLDLREQTGISYTTPEVNGLFNGWCGNCSQMTDVNNDSIWEITIPLLEGSGPVSGAPGWAYKFSADNWGVEENLFEGDPCVYGQPPYVNRYIHVTQDTVLPPVCWGSCNDCFVPQTSYNVTFQLDMANVSGFSVPEINGVFNGWCGSCWSMTDIDGDDIWAFTALIDTSVQEYKFSADNWTIQENLDSNLSCILINYDPVSPNGWGYVNRYLNINSDTILDPVCWQDCFTCSSITNFSWDCDGQGNCYDPGTGTGFYSDSIACIMNCQANTLTELNNEGDYNVYPNPTSEMIYIKSKENIDMIVVYNKIGQKVFQIDYPSIMTEIDFSGQKSDIYFMEIYNRTNIYREKVIYIH